MNTRLRYSLKPQSWAFSTALVAAAVSLALLIRVEILWAAISALISVAAWYATRASNRRDPIPFPYALRPLLLLPRGPHSPQRLKAVLGLAPGEQVLEIGPGTGTHALPIAEALVPAGVLQVLDVQQAMLDHVSRRAARAGVTNIITTHGDAQALPYPDGTFDAAYMVGALGEIPDEDATLRELNRVLKPQGRLVIGEVFFDPDFVTLSELAEHAAAAGLVLQRTSGLRGCYFARFRPTNRPAGAQANATVAITPTPAPALPPA